MTDVQLWQVSDWSFAMERRAKTDRRRRNLAARDAEYAKLGTRVTVEVRDLRDSELGCIMRVETRGQRCIGWRSCGHVSHN